MQRRRLLALAAPGLAALSALGGCGFELRQPVALNIERLALVGFAPHSPMAAAIRRALPAQVQVLPRAAGAQRVLRALDDRFERTVAASTAYGEVREFRLRVSLRFQLLDGRGQVLIDDTLLEQERDMSYTETAALAKEVEQRGLVEDMRDDMARQLMRMLATANTPVAPASAPAPAASAGAQAG